MSQDDELQESIRLAVEAAEAANDTAAEVSRLKADTLVAAEKIQSFGGKMKPILIGTLIGAVGSMGLAGLIYFRTVGEMRTTAATQIEALTLFTQSVEQLDGQLSAVSELTAVLADMQGKTDMGFEDVKMTVTDVHELILSIQQEAKDAAEMAAAEMEAAGEEDSSPMQSQMASTILDAVEKGHTETQAAILAGNSDLQLALTRMLADGLAPQPAQKKQATATSGGSTQSKPKPAASKPKPKAKPKAKPRSTARPASNPFSYP